MDDTINVLEHQHCALLARLDAVTEQLGALASPLLDLLAYLEGEVGEHFALEERALFPIMGRHPEIAAGPLRVMEEEHASFRVHLGRLADALRHGTVASQVGAVETLADVLRAHIAKEDTVLFALARLTLSPAERREVERLARESG